MLWRYNSNTIKQIAQFTHGGHNRHHWYCFPYPSSDLQSNFASADWNQFIYSLVLSAARAHSLLSNWCDCNNDVHTPHDLYLVKTIAVLWLYYRLQICNHGSHVTPMCTPYLVLGILCSSCCSLLPGILPHCMHKQYCLGNERNTLTTRKRKWDPLWLASSFTPLLNCIVSDTFSDMETMALNELIACRWAWILRTSPHTMRYTKGSGSASAVWFRYLKQEPSCTPI